MTDTEHSTTSSSNKKEEGLALPEYFVLAHLFTKVPKTGDSEGLFGLRVKLPPFTTHLITQRYKDTTSELVHDKNVFIFYDIIIGSNFTHKRSF